MAAHLFIFYFATLSFITPPVCVAIFVAATMAKAKPMVAALLAMKLAVVAFVVPFVFVYDQALLFDGPWHLIAAEFAGAILAFLAVSIALQGYFTGPVGMPLRVVLAISGVLGLLPDPTFKLPGLAIAVAAMAFCWFAGRRLQSPPAG
jgi:TRAP-type uncharacterized transport system fused permease subunit